MRPVPLRSRTRSLRRFARRFFHATCPAHGIDPDARETLDLFLTCACFLLPDPNVL